MERKITGFQVDEDGDWVAELDCGHSQHVRHRPPFQDRPWVLSEQSRSARIGTPIACPLCDRAELPAGLRLARSSPEWSEHTVPTGLLRAHRLARGTWGRIVLHHGRLRVSMATDPPLVMELSGAGACQAIPPQVSHEVEPLGPVRFRIDFLAPTGTQPQEAGPDDLVRPSAPEGGDPACWAGLLCPECGIVQDGSAHHEGCSHSG